MISHCRNLVKFYRSEEGGVLIQLLKSKQRLVKEHQLFDMNASIAALKNYRGNDRDLFLFHMCYLNKTLFVLARTHAPLLIGIRFSISDINLRIE